MSDSLTTEPRQQGVAGAPEASAPPEALGFALNFISGRGLLTTRDKQLGGIELKILELEIPDIAFPFDVTGGAERFKSRRCALRHLVFGLDGEELNTVLTRAELAAHGFVELRAVLREGYVELVGRFRLGDAEADIVLRAAPLLRSPQELALVFYDARAYGFLPVPAGLLPCFLLRALNLPFLDGSRAGIWIVRPAEYFLRTHLPRHGWKIPDHRDAQLIAAEVARGRITIAAGPEGDPTQRQIVEREPPAGAVLALEGVTTFAAAEQALAKGAIAEAYDRFREAVDDERGGRWAKERLLQIGAADPELALETRQLAEEVLKLEPKNPQALLALAAIALRERSWGEASNRYGALAEIASASKARADIIASELAAAAAAVPVDPVGALAAYERAAARARDSVVAHQALFELRQTVGDWDGAARAGERLVRLTGDSARQAVVHRQLGQLYRIHLHDLKKARVQFERALRLAPDDPGALEGLAETYAARGEPARATSYLARLAEQAEESGDRDRIVALNLRLGDIWERWLGDSETATTRYYRVLDVDPKNRTARLRLAELAEARGDYTRARALYEDVLAAEEASADPEVISDLVAAYTRLARVTISSAGPSAEAIACLERAVELDPNNRMAREELMKLLRARGEWGRLINLLEETASSAQNPEQARHVRLDAARIELSERRNHKAAQRHLQEVLDNFADDADALELLLPLLVADRDARAIQERLSAAANATSEPERRAELFFRLAEAQDEPRATREALIQVLEANPYHAAGAEKLVELSVDVTAEQRAIALLRLAVATPDDARRAQVLIERANLLWRQLARPEQAEAGLLEAAMVRPADIEPWQLLAALRRERGNIDGAQAALQMALGYAEGAALAQLHIRLAEVHKEKGEEQERVQHLEAALATSPDATVRQELADALSALGEQARLAVLLETWAEAAEAGERDILLLQAAELRETLGEDAAAVALYQRVRLAEAEGALPAARALERLARARSDFAAVVDALVFQLGRVDGEEKLPLLMRLLEAQLEVQDLVGLEATCLQVLEHDPRSLVAHRHLAERYFDLGRFADALRHLSAELLECTPEDEGRQTRRVAFVRAAALAREVDEAELARLAAAFDAEFPEAPPAALERPLGEMLRVEESWEQLLGLRRYQIADASAPPRALWFRDAAQVLHHHLGRSEEAVPYYRETIALDPQDAQSYQALLEIFEALGRKQELADLLFAMSQFAESGREAERYALRSALVYAHDLGDRQSARQVLRVTCERPDLDIDSPAWLDALRELELPEELANLLERSIGQEPEPGDGRLAELVGLLAGPLLDPDRARDWCERMIEAFPTAAEPYRLLVDLAAHYPHTADAEEVLSRWAEAQEGPARALVLSELAALRHNRGDADGALASLVEAAEADPRSETVLQQLVDRCTARGDFAQALVWLEKLAVVAEPGPLRNERLRRMLEVATDYADDSAAAARALAGLDVRSEDESRHLAQLCIEVGDLDGLTLLCAELSPLADDVLLRAAEVLSAGGRLAQARVYFDEALHRGNDADVWETAERAWGEAGRRGELGRFRLEVAATVADDEALCLRLLGNADLTKGDDEGDQLLAKEELVSMVRGLDLDGDVSLSWATYRAAEALDDTELLRRAARVLDATLRDRDKRLVPVLRTRIAEAFDNDRAEDAVILAERLMSLGDAEAERFLDQALSRAGRKDQLLHLLSERAERGGDEATSLWLRIASLHVEDGSFSEAQVALDKVTDERRTARWGELAYAVGKGLSLPEIMAQGAATAAKLAEGPDACADWLRRCAEVVWWLLDEPERARSLLRQAHELAPQSVPVVLAEARAALEEGSDTMASRILDEALAAYVDVEPAPPALLLMRAGLYLDADAQDKAQAAIDEAEPQLGDDADWGELGVLVRRMGDLPRAVEAFANAYELSRSWEESYLGALEASAAWQRLSEVLEARAEELEGAEAAARLSRAAQVCIGQLHEPERALELLERAVQAAPQLDDMLLAFELALEHERTPLVAALGGPLLARLELEHGARPRVLRGLVDALDNLGMSGDTDEARQELLDRGLANHGDKLHLARVLAESDPAAAAALMQQVVLARGGADATAIALEAIALWRQAGQDGEAAALLEQVLEQGADGVEVQQAAVELCTGETRLHALARLIELEGDDDWQPETRAEARLELARARLDTDDAEGALAYLKQAATWQRSATWALASEEALLALGHDEELATLWLEALETGEAPWVGSQAIDRLRRAADTFAREEALTEELRTLELLKARLPDDSGVAERLAALAAELGDRDRYYEVAQAQIQAASQSDARDAAVSRAVAVLSDRFDDARGALELARPCFLQMPTETLATVVERTYVKLQDIGEGIELFRQAADEHEDARVWLLERAARMAEGAALEEQAYALWRELLGSEPAHPAALPAALALAEQSGADEEAVAMLEAAAAHVVGTAAHDYLLEAAEIAQLRMQSRERELQLLRAAVEADARRADTATRLAALSLSLGELADVRELLLTERVTQESEGDLATQLVAQHEERGDAEAAAQMMEWFVERHPERAETILYRLALARRAGDAAALLDALDERLEDSQLDAEERAALHAEAGRAARSLADETVALEHLRAAVDGGNNAPDVLLDTWSLARQVGDEETARDVVDVAQNLRDALFSRTASAKGAERLAWLELLGEAHEAAGDDAGAIGAYSQALATAEGPPSGLVTAGLERLYRRRSDWDALLDLYATWSSRERDEETAAEVLYRAGVVVRDQLDDAARAENFFHDSLEHHSAHAGAQLAYGLMLWARQKWANALPYLETQIQPQAAEVPVVHLVALADCLRYTGNIHRALSVTERVIECDPTYSEAYARRAELLEAADELVEAETAWLDYVRVLGEAAEPNVLGPIFRRLAQAADRRGDAAAAMAHLEEAFRLQPDDASLLVALRELCEANDNWERAAVLRVHEAEKAQTADDKLTHYQALASIYRDRLGNFERAAEMLEKASEVRPGDVDLLWDLAQVHRQAGNDAKFLVVGERLLAMLPEAEIDAEFFTQMARAYEESAEDPVRAKDFYSKAAARAPDDADLKHKLCELALATGDYHGFTSAEEQLVAKLDNGDEKVERLRRLAETYVKYLSSPARAALALERARVLRPDDEDLTRRLADTLALDSKSYGKAADMYRSLLAGSPLDADLLRILARLSGQLGDTDRAYGYYAALLTLLPSDTEAQRFVQACRGARPVGPQRALTDADRAQGLLHSGQVSPFEEVFTPLARFAELTQPGDLARRGVSTERDQLGPTDTRKQYLQKVLEPLGLPKAELYMWRGGAFACEVELLNPPAILLGSVLAGDAAERQRAFLVARTAELYRSGHALCDKLPPHELAALIAALSKAVIPDAEPPGASADTERWLPVVARPMTPQIRSMLTPKVEAFLAAAASLDISAWRRAALSTAARTAMLVSCDVEEAVAAMFRLRGFDDVTDDQRVAMLQEAPEELDLVRFAVSEPYFKLRQSLGLALRRSK